MGRLCRESPVPIALDEELIGISDNDGREALLDAIRPRYVVLKPSLHGGLRGADEWVRLAKARGIGSWATSALESNVGLNAIAQWCAVKLPEMPQGLGTGQLFTDNAEGFPLRLEGSEMHFDPEGPEPDLLGWLGIELDG
jgi:O-succinylbenzoate synthase